MAAEPERLKALVAEIARFYVRDRPLLRAQEKMTALLAAGASR